MMYLSNECTVNFVTLVTFVIVSFDGVLRGARVKSVLLPLSHIVIHRKNYNEFTNITTLPKFTLLWKISFSEEGHLLARFRI